MGDYTMNDICARQIMQWSAFEADAYKRRKYFRENKANRKHTKLPEFEVMARHEERKQQSLETKELARQEKIARREKRKLATIDRLRARILAARKAKAEAKALEEAQAMGIPIVPDPTPEA